MASKNNREAMLAAAEGFRAATEGLEVAAGLLEGEGRALDARRPAEPEPSRPDAEGSIILEPWMFSERGLGLRVCGAALMVYAVIYAESRPGTDGRPVGTWHKSLGAFSAETGLARRAVTSAVRDLRDKGLIECLGLSKAPGDNANIRAFRVNARVVEEAKRGFLGA